MVVYTPHSSISAYIADVVLSWFFVLLRCYVRLGIKKSFGLDDWFALLSIILHTVGTGFALDAYYDRGLGRPLADVPLPLIPNLITSGRDLYVSLITYTISCCLIKTSFAITLYRIAQKQVQRRIIQGTVVMVVAVSIYYLFFCVFQCLPPLYAFQRFSDPYFLMVQTGTPTSAIPFKPHGHCLSTAIIHNSNYAHSAMLIVADLILGILLPILIVRGLKNLKWRVKVGVGLLLAVGAMASAGTVVRIYYTPDLATKETFYASNPIFTWSDIELSWCIIATSCALLKPLFDKFTSSRQSSDNENGSPSSWKFVSRNRKVHDKNARGLQDVDISGDHSVDAGEKADEEINRNGSDVNNGSDDIKEEEMAAADSHRASA